MVDELECVCSVLLAILFGHLADARNISWAAFSGYMVMRGHVSDTLVRGLLRIAGTGLGATLALIVTPLVSASPGLSAGALAVVGGLSLYGSITRRHAYAWLFVGLTFEMVLLDQMAHPGEPLLPFAATRAREVVAGTAACILVSWLSTRSLRRRWPGAPQPPPARLGWSPDAARHAALGALALVFVPLLASIWRGPDFAQSGVTIMAVMIIPASAIGASGLAPVTRRILLRVAGCAAGAALAAAFLFLAHAPGLALASAPVLLCGTVLGVALGRHIENGQGALAYAGTQFVLVILVTLVPDSYAHGAITPALERLVGILVGMALLFPVLVMGHVAASGRRGEDDGSSAEAGGV
jgi:uncharacterized membrane protein YccC